MSSIDVNETVLFIKKSEKESELELDTLRPYSTTLQSGNPSKLDFSSIHSFGILEFV